MLEGVGGVTSMPARRRPAGGATSERRGRGRGSGGGGRGGGRGAGRGGQQQNHAAPSTGRQPQLSIFQD